MKIEINFDRYEYVTREANPECSWDRGDTAAVVHIHGIKIADRYHDIDVPFDIESGVVYYLVWANYKTGDSFGHSDNSVEFIDLFKAEKLAEECASIARAAKGYSYTFKRENGRDCIQSAPWKGYFESLNDIHIEAVQLV